MRLRTISLVSGRSSTCARHGSTAAWPSPAVAHAAHQLHPPVGDLDCGLRRHELGHGGEVAGIAARDLDLGGSDHQPSGRLERHRAVDEPVLGDLEAADRLAEHLPLPRVLDGQGQRSPSHPEARRGRVETLPVHRREHLTHASVELTEHGIAAHLDVGEEHLTRRHAVDPERVDGRDRQPGGVGRHQEHRDAVDGRPLDRCRPGQHHDGVGHRRARRPHLLPGDAPAVARRLGPRLHDSATSVPPAGSDRANDSLASPATSRSSRVDARWCGRSSPAPAPRRTGPP